MTQFTVSNIDLIKSWAAESLSAHGLKPQSDFEDVRLMPWSSVWRAVTDQGPMYLKWMAPLFNREPKIIQFLADYISVQNLPIILSDNRGLSAFILEDAGIVLRDHMGAQYNTALCTRVLGIYADLQRQAIHNLPQLPPDLFHDYRLEKLPSLFDTFLGQTDFLKTNGVTVETMTRLIKLRPQFMAKVQQLAALNIPDTIEHGDFHDNNVLISNDHITLADWGDCAWSHPFFSGATFVNSAIKRGMFGADDLVYQNLRDAYVQGWQDYADLPALYAGFETARTLRPFIFALSMTRVYQTPGLEHYPELQGYMAQTLTLLSDNLTPQELPCPSPMNI